MAMPWENDPVVGRAPWKSDPVVGQESTPQESPGLIERGLDIAGGVAKGAAKATVRAVRGPEGLPDLPLFDAPAPTTSKTIKAAAGIGLTGDPNAQADIIRRNYPGIELTPVEAEGQTYYIGDWTDEGGKQHVGYIDAPGLDLRDVTSFAGDVLTATPAARLGRGAGLLERSVKVGAGEGATQAAKEGGTILLGSEQGPNLPAIVVAAGAGTLFAGLEPVAAKMWSALLRKKSYFDPATGKLTDRGKKVAEKAGLDPEQMTERMSKAFSKLSTNLPESADASAAANVAKRSEFDIRGTRGQATGDYGQLNLEERMRKGLEGEDAQRVMKQFDVDQQADIQRANEDVVRRMTGRETAGSEAGAAATVQEGMQRRASELSGAVDRAYEAVRSSAPLTFEERAARELPDYINARLIADDVLLDDVVTPLAVRGRELVMEALTPKGGRPLDLNQVDLARKRIGEVFKSSQKPTEKRALTIMKNAIDDWVFETVERGLFEGDRLVVDQLNDARSLRAEYGRLFSQRRKGDAAGKVVENILEKAESPEQVANYLFGRSRIGAKADTVNAVRRIKDIVGDDSEAWSSIRDMAWLRLSRNPRTGEPLSPKLFDTAWKEAKNKDASLLKELFSPPERRMIERYRDALMATQADPTNPSQTAFALENALRYTLRRFGQRESFTKGNVGKGTILNFLARMPLNPMGVTSAAKERAARQAVTDLAPPSAALPGATALGTAGAVEYQR